MHESDASSLVEQRWKSRPKTGRIKGGLRGDACDIVMCRFGGLLLAPTSLSKSGPGN